MTAPKRPLVIGLVGQIGAGKSTVASMLRELGCTVYDADAESRREFETDEAQQAMRDEWGSRVVGESGRVERSLVGNLVFGEPEHRLKLEAIIHPRLVAARDCARSEAIQTDSPAVIIDAPLLYEAEIDGECDAVICVTAPDATRVERVRSRGWDSAELARRDRAQIDIEIKKMRAHVVIENAGDLDTLNQLVKQSLADLIAAFRASID